MVLQQIKLSALGDDEINRFFKSEYLRCLVLNMFPKYRYRDTFENQYRGNGIADWKKRRVSVSISPVLFYPEINTSAISNKVQAPSAIREQVGCDLFGIDMPCNKFNLNFSIRQLLFKNET